MALGIKKNILSFELLEGTDPKTLLFLDTSHYMEEPTRPLLEITMPGHNKYTLVNIVHRKVNVLNSTLVGLSQLVSSSELQPLPDGLWVMKYKICPYELVYVQKMHMRTTQLQCSLSKAFDLLDVAGCSDNEVAKKQLVDIMLLSKYAEAEALLNNAEKATDAYGKASRMLGDLLNRLNANC